MSLQKQYNAFEEAVRSISKNCKHIELECCCKVLAKDIIVTTNANDDLIVDDKLDKIFSIRTDGKGDHRYFCIVCNRHSKGTGKKNDGSD